MTLLSALTCEIPLEQDVTEAALFSYVPEHDLKKGFHGSRPSLRKMGQLEGPRTERTRRWPQGGGEQLCNTENRAPIFQQSQSPPMKLGFLGSRSTVPRPSPTRQSPLVKLGPCGPEHWHDRNSSRKVC